MGVNRYKGTWSSDAALVNRYIGTAYDHVKNVSDNIDDVKTVADALGEDFPEDGLDILVENIDDVVAAGSNIEDAVTVARIKDEVVTVAGIEQEIIDVPSYTAQAIDAANAAEEDADRAETEADRSTAEADRSTTEADRATDAADTALEKFEATFAAQFAYMRIGNISDYVGQSLSEAEKLNAYQYPDDSGNWYGAIQGQTFPVTIPADPSTDNGWALVNQRPTYQGLWPDTVGSAYKGDTYQTQVSGTPTGQYFTALQDTTVDPIDDGVNWREIVTTEYVTSHFTLAFASVDAMLVAGELLEIGQLYSTGGTTWEMISKSDPVVIGDFEPLTSINVKDWGAVDDNVTDNTPVFVAIADYVTARGGFSTIDFPNSGGVYRWNQWKNSTDPSYWGESDIMLFDNVDSVYINGNGCTIKAFDNIRIGSFDPVTGDAMSDRQTNGIYANGCGNVITFQGKYSNVHISDLNIDGNLPTRIVGGQFGDTGYQVQEKALRMRGTGECLKVSVSNCDFSYMGVDGMAIAFEESSEGADPNIIFSNVRCTYNGRQGLSLVGGQNLRFENCNFSYTGRSVLQSSPGSGVDIEPEGGQYVTDCVFDSCTFSYNVGQAVLTAVGSSRMRNNIFENCIIHSNDNNAVYTTSFEDLTPAIFNDCTIMGPIYVCGNSHFNGCLITDRPNEQFPEVEYRNYLVDNVDIWAKFTNCIFDLEFSRIGYYIHSLTNCTIKIRYDADVQTYTNIGLRSNRSRQGWGGNILIDMMTGTDERVCRWAGNDPLPQYTFAQDTKYAIDRVTGDPIPWRDGLEFSKFDSAPETFHKRISLSNNDRPSPHWGDADTCITFVTNRDAIPVRGTFTKGTVVIDYTVNGSGALQASICSTAGEAGTTAVFKPFWYVDQKYNSGV